MKTKWNPKLATGLFGGTFDPVHHGHLSLAHALIASGKIQQMIFVPAAVSPFKVNEAITPSHHRLAMLRLATGNFPQSYISDFELQQSGISYTINTALHFVKELGNNLYLVIGADCLRDLHLWKRAATLAADFQFIIYQRPEFPLPDELTLGRHFGPEIARKLLASVWSGPLSVISASTIRQRLANGQSIVDWTPKPVIEYIQRHHLYQS